MISYENAVLQAIDGDKSLMILDSWDMGEFYLFSIAPVDWPVGKMYDVGTVFTAVDKKSAKVFPYNIMENPELFLEAQKLE